MLGRLTRIAVQTVLTFYAARAAEQGRPGAKSGAVTAVQRTSADLRLNPHLHMIALDGAWSEDGGELGWEGLGHLGTSEVGEVLERLVRRMERHLRRSGQLRTFEDEAEEGGKGDPEGKLAASAVSGRGGGWPCEIHRLDLATERTELWKQASPPDATGMVWCAGILPSADGESYVCVANRSLASLIVAEELR